MIISKLTSKSQTTIPQPVRMVLQLEPGDKLVYELVDGTVLISKWTAETLCDDPFGTFTEWLSDADEEAYGNL